MATEEDHDNPYRAPTTSDGLAAPLADLPVTLVDRSWWRRAFRVETKPRPVEVIYNGRGLGYEQVLVDGHVAVRKRSWFWFVPHFEFQFAGHSATFDVAVWPWFAISTFRFTIDGDLVYEEHNVVPRGVAAAIALAVAAGLVALLGAAGGPWILIEGAR